jgi:hypothetical protein
MKPDLAYRFTMPNNEIVVRNLEKYNCRKNDRAPHVAYAKDYVHLSKRSFIYLKGKATIMERNSQFS